MCVALGPSVREPAEVRAWLKPGHGTCLRQHGTSAHQSRASGPSLLRCEVASPCSRLRADSRPHNSIGDFTDCTFGMSTSRGHVVSSLVGNAPSFTEPASRPLSVLWPSGFAANSPYPRPRYTGPVKTRLGWFCAVIHTAGFAAAALALPQVARVPVPPIRTAVGVMPGVGELPSRPALPDVLTFESGGRVTTAAQWAKRRGEMKRILAYYATGSTPPGPGNVTGRELRSADVLGGTVRYRLVRLSFGPGSRCGFDVAVFVPASAKGRIPVVVFPTFGPTPGGTPLATMVRPPEQGKGMDALVIPLGNQAARAAEAAAATPQKSPVAPPAASASDPESAAAAHAELLRRGYALAIYHYQDTGEDTIGRMKDGSWESRSGSGSTTRRIGTPSLTRTGPRCSTSPTSSSSDEPSSIRRGACGPNRPGSTLLDSKQ